MNFVFVKRLKDGQVLDMTKQQAEETIKRGGFEMLSEEVQRVEPEVEEVEVQDFTCILCGFVGKNAQALRMHRNKAHA